MWLPYVTVGVAIILLTPILVDCLRAFLPNWKIVRLAGPISSYVLVVLITLISLVAIWYHFAIYLSMTVKDPLSSFKGWAHLLFAFWIWTNVVGNYFLAVFVEPGVVDQERGEIPSHYCSYCQNRIAYMDHHCPFTANCVGLNNYSYFMLGLLYAFLGLLYAWLMTFPYLKMCWVDIVALSLLRRDYMPATFEMKHICQHLKAHSLIGLPVFLGMVAVFMLLLWQLLLLLGNTSTAAVLKGQHGSFTAIFKRIKQQKWRESKSRLKIALLSKGKRWYHFLLPFRQDYIDVSHLT